ncbi:LAMI_0E06502g1_1 [Lachancea mirantina]|uniref:LAMI_0E06502g1_1 n=1 Tax=Lachancea mirantina TaxID=1230905 RepID=A0A1G4JLV0_9SACH|nr:LAMI_0E06502g1_1 [Lachancea mirantina]
MTQGSNTTLSLKTLTAHQLLTARQNMAELFGLLDDSERQELLVGSDRDQTLKDMKAQVEALRREDAEGAKQ